MADYNHTVTVNHNRLYEAVLLDALRNVVDLRLVMLLRIFPVCSNAGKLSVFTSMLSSPSCPITGQQPHSFVLVSPCVNKYIYSHTETREQEEEVSAERCGADEKGRRVDLYAIIVNVKFGSGTQTFS